MAQYDYVDPNDERLQNIENEKNIALNNGLGLYDEAIEESQKGFTDLIDKSNTRAEEQKKIANENTEFAIDQIEQNKEYLKQDMQKELSGAYTDWQKQSNPYGANAEVMASQGLQGSGYAESSKVSMYNTYQNRVSTALESFQRAVTDYNNAIHEAKLQNSSLLAEIAYNALKEELSLTLQGMQYKNTLLIEKANKELAIKQYYDSKWLDQYKLLMDEKKLEIANEQFQEEMEYKNRLLDNENGGLIIDKPTSDEPSTVDTSPVTAPVKEEDVAPTPLGTYGVEGLKVTPEIDKNKTYKVKGKDGKYFTTAGTTLIMMRDKGYAIYAGPGEWVLTGK